MKTNPDDFIEMHSRDIGDRDGSIVGLTKREYFTAMAMQAYAAVGQIIDVAIPECAVDLADRTIEELNNAG